MSQATVDQQIARRRAAMWMFVVLVLGVVGLAAALILPSRFCLMMTLCVVSFSRR